MGGALRRGSRPARAWCGHDKPRLGRGAVTMRHDDKEGRRWRARQAGGHDGEWGRGKTKLHMGLYLRAGTKIYIVPTSGAIDLNAYPDYVSSHGRTTSMPQTRSRRQWNWCQDVLDWRQYQWCRPEGLFFELKLEMAFMKKNLKRAKIKKKVETKCMASTRCPLWLSLALAPLGRGLVPGLDLEKMAERRPRKDSRGDLTKHRNGLLVLLLIHMDWVWLNCFQPQQVKIIYNFFQYYLIYM